MTLLNTFCAREKTASSPPSQASLWVYFDVTIAESESLGLDCKAGDQKSVLGEVAETLDTVGEAGW